MVQERDFARFSALEQMIFFAINSKSYLDSGVIFAKAQSLLNSGRFGVTITFSFQLRIAGFLSRT
jgi:hypothetical protein